MFFNKYAFDKNTQPNRIHNNEDFSPLFSSFTISTEVTPNTESAFSIESTDEDGNIETSDNTRLLIMIILMNTFFFLIFSFVCGLCLYCKRNSIFHKPLEVKKDGNVEDRKGLFSPDVLHKRPDLDLEMTKMENNSRRLFTNENPMPGSLGQNQDYQNIYDTCSEPDPCLVSETVTNETNSELSLYITVV